MNKIKKNLAGMTLVEILVSMTIFAMMFAMVIGIMITSIRMNAETQVYDQEIDTQVEDVERFNPMGAYIDGITSGTTNISEYNASGATNKNTMTFTFGSYAISVDGYSYVVNSYDAENAMGMKFFSSTRPDTANGKYWIRLINASSEQEKTLYLILPKDDHGVFYQKNGTETFSSQMMKKVEKDKALSIGFDSTDSGNLYFWYSDKEKTDEANMTEGNGYYKIEYSNILTMADSAGYIDIYYTDDGFKSKTEYLDGI